MSEGGRFLVSGAAPRLICIGDVHGCVQELDALVSALHPQIGDRFVFVGDIVDRGPDPAAAVRLVRRLVAQYPTSAVVSGNHEAKLVKRIQQGSVDRPEWQDQLEQADIEWLAGLPLFVRSRAHDLIVVHAGIPPRYFEHYTDIPDDAYTKVSRKQRDRMALFRYCRYVDDRGGFVSLSARKPEDRFWADVYDGREGFCVFGHQPFLDGVAWFPHALGLDAGCVFGGHLAAAVWEGAGPGRPQIVVQRAFARYADPITDDD